MKRILPYAAAGALLAPLGAMAAHPLVSDDPGTQGNGNWQFELNAEQTPRQADTGYRQLWNATLTRGFGERVESTSTRPIRISRRAPTTTGPVSATSKSA